jgi:hypothetical protein
MAGSCPPYSDMNTLYAHSPSALSSSTGSANSFLQSSQVPIDGSTSYDNESLVPYRYSKQQAPHSYDFPQQIDESPLMTESRLSGSPVSRTFTDQPPDTSSVERPTRHNSHRSASRITIAHPYARLYAKKDASKRRKIWNHVLEKQLFSPQELCVAFLHLFQLNVDQCRSQVNYGCTTQTYHLHLFSRGTHRPPAQPAARDWTLSNPLRAP